MNTKLASLSIDLDEVDCYGAIHGVDVPPNARHVVYDRCLPRLRSLLDELSVPATFFAIGSDLQRRTNQETVHQLHESGHEIGNHSFHHRYDMSRQSDASIREDIERGAAAIEEACGRAPAGFRAPGYIITDSVFSVLKSLDVMYDSSVFPSPAYFAAKTSALAWIALRGRKSHSRLDTPAVLRAPRQPYRVGVPYWRRGTGIVEIPIGVTRWGLPYIGTSLVLSGTRAAHWLTSQIIGTPVVHIELHGFDAADSALDGLEFLSPHRPDLRRPAADKLETIASVITTLRDAGYKWVTLEKVAQRELRR